MKKLREYSALVSMVTVLSGCVPSVYPLYTNSDVITDDRIVGEWWQPDAEYPWTITKTDPNTYSGVLTNAWYGLPPLWYLTRKEEA